MLISVDAASQELPTLGDGEAGGGSQRFRGVRVSSCTAEVPQPRTLILGVPEGMAQHFHIWARRLEREGRQPSKASVVWVRYHAWAGGESLRLLHEAWQPGVRKHGDVLPVPFLLQLLILLPRTFFYSKRTHIEAEGKKVELSSSDELPTPADSLIMAPQMSFSC